MKLMPDIITVTAYVAQMDLRDMAELNTLFWGEVEHMEGTVDFDDAKRLTTIFDKDWDAYKWDRGHSFVFSVEFMMAMEPLLQRTDVDKIYFEVEEIE